MAKNQITIIVGLAAALIFVVLGVFVFSFALETFDAKAEELVHKNKRFGKHHSRITQSQAQRAN